MLSIREARSYMNTISLRVSRTATLLPSVEAFVHLADLPNHSVEFPADSVSTLEKHEHVKSVEADQKVTTQ